MVRSLRFQLPALFLLGVVVAGLVSAAIALRLFRAYAQNRARDQAYAEVNREARGLTRVYSRRAGYKLLPARTAELATGDKIFYAGLDLFPGRKSGFRALPRGVLADPRKPTRALRRFEFAPPGSDQTLLASARPLKIRHQTFGTIVVSKPKTVLNQRWLALIERLLLAFAGGVAVAAAFAWYLSRRITTPVLELSRAADRVSRGHYDVAVPRVPGGGEIGMLADSFREMAARLSEAEELERNFLMSVSHELRTPLTAIRGHVEALREGVFSEEARRRRIDYRCEIEAKPVILSDGDRVLQIISNLLSNAFRWTPDGGRIELELKAVDGTVCVAVEDTGPGIMAAERERIFRPFWSRDGSGTGLGLAIAGELAGALGGRIRLETAPDRGSRFTLVLPSRPE